MDASSQSPWCRTHSPAQASLAQVGSLGVRRLVSLGWPAAAGGGACSPALPPSSVHCVALADSDDADLLTALPGCVAFAEAARLAGAPLLVACEAGVSRSAAVAAAVLASRRPGGGLSAVDALALVVAAHPGACPNDGFVAQLGLWSRLGGVLRGPLYRRHRVALAAAGAAGGGGAPEEEDEGPGSGDRAGDGGLLCATPADGGGAPPPPGGALRCRACRRLLAAGEHVVAHEPGAGAGAFQGGGRGGGCGGGGAHNAAASSSSQPCTSLFLEPMAWMRPQLGGCVAGKLACPGCGSRLGSFSWAGGRCSCAAWVVPSFQLHAARVDRDARG